MEQLQRYSIAMEGQNSIEQFDMEMLAHAMYGLTSFCLNLHLTGKKF